MQFLFSYDSLNFESDYESKCLSEKKTAYKTDKINTYENTLKPLKYRKK